MGRRLVERRFAFGLALAILLGGCAPTSTLAPRVTPPPTAQPTAAVPQATYDDFHAGYCSAWAALFATIGKSGHGLRFRAH